MTPAVKGPGAGCVGVDQHRQAFRRLHRDRVLAGKVLSASVLELHPHAVQVDRVLHHRVVDQDQPQALPEFELDLAAQLGVALAVERPHVALHVPGQMQLQLALGRTLRPRRRAAQVGVDT